MRRNLRALTFLAALFGAVCQVSTVGAASAGSALRFNGTNGYVLVTNNAALNAYPLTVSAWFRTTNATIALEGLVSKYADATGNGWSLILQNGRLRGFYYRANGTIKAIDSTYAALVTDGFWHQAALVVDGTGGKLYYDGILVGSSVWTGGTGAAPVSSEPLLIGEYWAAPYVFQGDIDEVTIWNRGLGAGELNYLKHRQLFGNEDGLLGLWHLDEGGGISAADATGHGFTGAVTNSPQWISSTAPIVFSSLAGSGLKFDGVNDQVLVTNTAGLNTLPFSMMAWVRSSQSNLTYPAILTKYVGSSFNGFGMALNIGRLDSWYYVSSTRYVEPGFSSASDRFIADGQWHHVAFVVDTNSGRSYIDGQLVNTQPWIGAPGVTTSPEIVRIGDYLPSATSFFGGVIDHVSIWGAALSAGQVQQYGYGTLGGAEPGLLAAWELNEGSGTNTIDLTGAGHDGVLTNGPIWVGSTAFLGDGTSAIHAELGPVTWTRKFAVTTMPTQRGFAASAPSWVRRLDDFGAPGASITVTSIIQSALQATIAGPIPLANNSTQNLITLPAFNAAAPQSINGGVYWSPAVNAEPQVQLDSVNDTFQLSVSETYAATGGPIQTGESETLPPVQLLHFDGNLYFGSIQTIFTNISNTPTPGAPAGGGINTSLKVIGFSGTVSANPAFHYGSSGNLAVVLLPDGDATASAGTVVPLSGSDSDCIQNMCYGRTGLTLSNDAFRGTITLQLPAGFSVCTNFSVSNRYTVGRIAFPNTLLSTAMQPQANSLVLGGGVSAIEETKPVWIQSPTLAWQVYDGQIVLNPTGLLFVRQEDDALLTAAQAFLTDPNAANRISNDGYYRNAGLGSNQVTVTADANGVALLSTIIALNPPELRPHFPYSGRTNGMQIPTTTGGQLVIQDGLLDTVSSFLPISDALPAVYARDCFDTNCSLATISAAVLAFATVGNTLNFTPDGGLLAYGAVPPTNLTWGYAGDGNFAQRTSDVQAGAYHMPGTFLRSDQSAVTSGARPAVLLFSGFGDDADPTYFERPGQANYADGFANYAGLNFRAPAQGRSLIANSNTDWYPLTPRSKYYARFGGVSGIHESATSPGNLVLYGYPFAFTSYRLSYLDSENWESRTDGAVSLPVPAGFQVEFQHMKFLCKGGLDSAQLPPFTPPKEMVYWKTWITPQSIEFHPTNNDVCGTSARFLVLGAETKLPFLGQAFHATLGFKNNGNLVTSADNVVGCDSRFPVPGHLTLQGPGASSFPLETASDGYFNNWETAGAPADGFFNLAGKLRVPFFQDIKVHLHVTPSSQTQAHIDIMGGWPSPDGGDQDFGWNIGTANYFNTAKFDRHHDSFPAGPGGVAGYRGSSNDKYHPRAQRDWIQVAKFNYPLQWNSALHEFAGFADKPVILPVIDVNSRLKELSPGKVDFDFSQDLSIQLPVLKVLDFANDALNEINAPINSLSNALKAAISQAFDTSGLTSGFRSLQRTLREDASSFFRPVVQGSLTPAANQIYVLLSEMQRTNAAGLRASIVGIVNAPAVNLQNAIGSINGSAAQANTVLSQLNQTFDDVDKTLGLFLRALQKANDGTRPVISVIVKQLVHDQGPALGVITQLGDDVLSSLLQDLEPTLAKIESDLRDLRGQFGQLRSSISLGSGDFNTAVNAILNDGNALNTYAQAAAAGVSNLVATTVGPASDYFDADPGAAISAIRERLIVAFLGSSLPASYQQTFKQFMSDDNFLLDQLMDVLFDQLNRSIRDGLTSGNQNDAFSAMKGIGAMSQSLLSAKIRGAPTFEGDSLRRIHLDAAVQMNLPDEMHFNAYMDIKELVSQTVPQDCIPPGAPAAEVTLGAKDVPLNWAGVTASKPLTLTVEGRWTLQSGSVLGIGGLFDIKGEAGFKGCSVKEIGATFAIGELENYFAAKAAGNIIILGIPVDMEAGVFAGHACSLDPLKFIDPNADKVLNDPVGFRGLYVQYGGGLSLSEILFGTSSCWLDVQAGISTAIYYEGGPRSGKIGFRQQESLDLELACVLSGRVELGLGASVAYTPPTNYEIDLVGDAQLCGKIGYCPFCLSGCKGITIKGVVKDGGVDYFIDF